MTYLEPPRQHLLIPAISVLQAAFSESESWLWGTRTGRCLLFQLVGVKLNVPWASEEGVSVWQGGNLSCPPWAAQKHWCRVKCILLPVRGPSSRSGCAAMIGDIILPLFPLPFPLLIKKKKAQKVEAMFATTLSYKLLFPSLFSSSHHSAPKWHDTKSPHSWAMLWLCTTPDSKRKHSANTTAPSRLYQSKLHKVAIIFYHPHDSTAVLVAC